MKEGETEREREERTKKVVPGTVQSTTSSSIIISHRLWPILSLVVSIPTSQVCSAMYAGDCLLQEEKWARKSIALEK